MLRRSSPALIAFSVFALLLFGCGNPSSQQANEAGQEDEVTVETAGAPEEGEDVAAQDDEEEVSEDEASGDDAGSYDRQPSRPRRAGGAVATRDVGAGVRGDVGIFYDDLSRDGAWVPHSDYSYVWIPSRMGFGWRPYQEGRWIWTDAYGWYWESDEPFGWAVYHYGRWDYDPDYGWFWVPGDTWAPAWVTWRFGGDIIGWAPIAPDWPGFAVGQPRRYAPPIAESWVFVDARDFTAPDLAPYVLPISRIGPSLTIATDIRTPRYVDGRMVNFGAPRDEVQRFVRGPIQSRELFYVDNPDSAFDDVRGQHVGIYRPFIADRGARKPGTVVEITKSGRVIVREYARGGPSAYDVPSAALLDVLDASERRGLRETRLTAKEAAVDQRLKQLRKERAALLKARQEEAERLETELEKERKKAMAERRRNQETLRDKKQQRAADIKIETPAAAAGDAKAGAPESAQPPAPPVQDAVVPAELAAPKSKAKAKAPALVETKANAPAEPADQPVELVPQPAPPAEALPEPAPAPEQTEGSPASRAPDGAEASPDGAAGSEPVAGDVPERMKQKKKSKPPVASPDAEANPVPLPASEIQPEAPPPTPAEGAVQEQRGKKKGNAAVGPQDEGAAANAPSAPPMQTPTPESSEPAPAPIAPPEAATLTKRKKNGPAEGAAEAPIEDSPPADMPGADPAPVAPMPVPAE